MVTAAETAILVCYCCTDQNAVSAAVTPLIVIYVLLFLMIIVYQHRTNIPVSFGMFWLCFCRPNFRKHSEKGVTALHGFSECFRKFGRQKHSQNIPKLTGMLVRCWYTIIIKKSNIYITIRGVTAAETAILAYIFLYKQNCGLSCRYPPYSNIYIYYFFG